MPAKSKNQQQFMGMVHGVQKGEIDPKDVSQDVRDAAKNMKKKDAKDFASTKHKGLPDKVKKENMDEIFEQVFNETESDLVEFNKERNERIKKEVIRRLKQEALPTNWMDGRSVTNQHTAKGTSPRDYDNDETNFKVKYSGQPDLESDLDESAMGTIDLLAQEAPNFKKFLKDVFKEFKDMDKSKEAIAWLKSIYDERTNESVNEGWKDWFKKKSKPKVDPGTFKQQALKALASALKDDDIYPGDIEEWLETKVTHRYGGYDTFGKDKWPERLSDKDLWTAKGIISRWERYDANGDNKGVESSKKNLYNHLKRTLK